MMNIVDNFIATREIKDRMGNSYLRKVEDRFLYLLDKDGNSLRLAVDIKMKNGDVVTIVRSGDYSFRNCSGDSYQIKVNDGTFSDYVSYNEMLNFIGYYSK